MSYACKVAADSIMSKGHRLATLMVTMPRIILAELNTHRVLSRNSASSRAIPLHKMVASVKNNPFVPIRWMKDHKGMQGIEYITDPTDLNLNIGEWLRARNNAVTSAEYLNHGVEEGRDNGVSKQICNRLLEPWMWTTVLLSATEWENFLSLRAHKDAEIHFQKTAEMILDSLNASVPVKLQPGEWHIPFGDQMSGSDLIKLCEHFAMDPSLVNLQKLKIEIAVARCAGVSYTIADTEGKPMNYRALKDRHDMLAFSGHWSPFEHCAQAMTIEQYKNHSQTYYDFTEKLYRAEFGWCANFRGFIQYRRMFARDVENRLDNRLIKR